LILNSTWARIREEIEKCDVLCANCHRRKSAAEFNYKRHVFVNI
jgi:formate-dependent nitrite reductase cytochrome c552 subunit